MRKFKIKLRFRVKKRILKQQSRPRENSDGLFFYYIDINIFVLCNFLLFFDILLVSKYKNVKFMEVKL